MARLTKAKVKIIKAKTCDLSYEELVDLKVSIERRLAERRKDKELKLTLKRKLSNIVAEDQKHLIGYIEKQAYESFYGMPQNNIKYAKGLKCGNYMDYLCYAELRTLNAIRSKLINDLSTLNIKTIGAAESHFRETGFKARRWFLNTYKVLPEKVPAEEVSVTVCESISKRIEDLVFSQQPTIGLTEKENGQVVMDFDVLTKQSQNQETKEESKKTSTNKKQNTIEDELQ